MNGERGRALSPGEGRVGEHGAGQQSPVVPSIRFYLPVPALRDLVTSYYLIDSAGPLTEWLHPEWGNIRFSLRGHWSMGSRAGPEASPRLSSLFGPTDRTRSFATKSAFMMGVGLTPLGWLKIVRTDASKLANALTPLGDTLGMPGDEIAAILAACPDDAARCAFFDDLLGRRSDHQHPDERLAMEAHRILLAGSAETIDDFASAMGLSDRTLNRLCLRVFGFGPKRLLRRQRFLRTLARIRDRLDQPLGAVLDPAYYDQAHFIREFRAYMGVTPTAYFNSPREVMRRVAEERMRVVGAPVQGLHGS